MDRPASGAPFKEFVSRDFGSWGLCTSLVRGPKEKGYGQCSFRLRLSPGHFPKKVLENPPDLLFCCDWLWYLKLLKLGLRN